MRTPASEGIGSQENEASDVAQAVAVLGAYYEAINRKDYARAYTLWASSGEASGKSLAEFSQGFANTQAVTVTTDRPGSIEGAAGSRYIDVPASITARQSDGRQQHFVGTYTLRRSDVDGATLEQRQWRIFQARVVEKQD